MIGQSPFTASRFEYEGRHLFYLPASLFPQFREAKPVYVIGSRGTGKTTLLKALHWRERLNNEWLRQALGGELFADRCVGVYMKLPDTILTSMDTWLSCASDAVRETVVGLFYDLSALQLISEASAELLSLGIVDGSPATEHTVVARIGFEFPWLVNGSRRQMKTLYDLSQNCRERLDVLQRAVLHQRDVQEIVSELPRYSLGHLGRYISRAIADLLNSSNQNNHLQPWYFKFCLDEAECLSPYQLLVLNTYVRLAEWPLFPIASFVQKPKDITTTLRQNLTISNDDCRIIPLDAEDASGFSELATGVANIRAQWHLQNPTFQLDLKKILGKVSINSLLTRILQSSASPKAHELLDRAAALAEHPFFAERSGNIQEYEDDSGDLPIYQAYLIEQLRLSIPRPIDPKWQQRKQESAELRKRMVAAYLAICEELSADVLYCSWDMLIQLSDFCMRDFLRQLERVFRASGKDLDQFAASTISQEVQSRALTEASLAKRDSIPRSELRVAAKDAGRVIAGLAMITAAIQRRSPDGSHLRSSERGIIQVTFPPTEGRPGPQPATVRDIIADVGQAGFLRLLTSEGNTWTFRVHCSLAPAYGFSYRGAYYPCKISTAEIEALRCAADEESLHSAAKTIVGRLQNETSMPLFEDIHRDKTD